MKTIQPNDNPMNYVPVGANRIRPNNRFATTQIRNKWIRPNQIQHNRIQHKNISQMKTGANAIRPYQIHQKFNIVLLR